MKVRLGILVFGVLLGLIFKWALPDVDANPKPDPSSKSGEKQTADSSEPHALNIDPLVPPANIEGIVAFADGTSASVDNDLDPAISPFQAAKFLTGERALFEPHGDKVCASGCAVSRHPTDKLTLANFRQLTEQFADDPIDETSAAFEELLFYGRQTQSLLSKYGGASLDPARESALREELTRTNARISIRLVDEDGEIRSSLPPTHVPLDRRHVFSMDVKNVQPLVTSGTVKRVGLNHLWTRL